jgi:hypothetical protein
MTPEEHKKRHQELHKALDELAADFMSQTGRLVSQTTVMELIQWSYHQTIRPTEKKRR